MKKLTLQDIAKELNISKATISIVLNGRGDEKRVSKETQERIIQFAKENNYKANHLARGLSLGKSDTIGLVVPNIGDTYYARIARRVERKARKSGYNVVFSSTGEDGGRESELIQGMLNRGVDGLIIASSEKNKSEIEHLKNSNYPFVLIERWYPGLETNFVGEDNKGGVVSAVMQLLKTGRRRIGFVTLKPELEAIQKRLEGYTETMSKNSLPVQDGFIQELEYEYTEEEMYDIIHEMINLEGGIDGLVFSTHFLAGSGMRALRKLNVKVPEDVALISFGQMNAFDLVEPPITSVIQPIEELGDKAVEMLMDNLEKGKQQEHDQRIILKNRLEIRRSCGE